MQILPLHKALGAEVIGVDLRQTLDDATIKALRSAFDEHIVLVIRGQSLDEEAQLRAAGYFGKVAYRSRPLDGIGPGGNYESPFMMVSNIVKDGKPIGAFGDGEMWFHHDTIHRELPTKATMLYSVQVPTYGGETVFSNLFAAYEALPKDLKNLNHSTPF